MFVAEKGSGPAVLLLHGTPSPARDWDPVADDLARSFRVLIPELPGYGQSPQLAVTSIETVGDELAEMLDAREIDRLHAIVGFSTGVYRGFDLVLRHRVGVRHVISLAGMASFDDDARAMRRGFADMLDADPQFLERAETRALVTEMMLSATWRADHPDCDAQIGAWLQLSSRAALVAELRALAVSRDLRAELRTLDAHVYARVGALDQGAPPAWSEEIVHAVPHGELEVVAGCGHALLIEDLSATTAAISTRLRRQ